MFEKRYLDQVGILLNILPLFNKYKDFAIKGGTAINFFVFEAPRLSVDIDLCFLPIKKREQTFIMINEAMSGLGEEINRRFPEYSVNRNKTRNAYVYKLTISKKSISVWCLKEILLVWLEKILAWICYMKPGNN
jgi:hypothetical protein